MKDNKEKPRDELEEAEDITDFSSFQSVVRKRKEDLRYICRVHIKQQENLAAYHREEVSKWLLTWGYHFLILFNGKIITCLDISRAGNADYLPPERDNKDRDVPPSVANTLFVAVPVSEEVYTCEEHQWLHTITSTFINKLTEELQLIEI